MKKLLFLLAICGILGLGIQAPASANLTTYNLRTAFNAQGTIDYNYGFEDFGSGFTYPGDPWTSHGVTYTSGKNLIAGPTTFYLPISNVLVYDFWSPLTANIDTSTHFNMFALDLGYIGADSQMTFTVTTNLAGYTFPGLSVPNASLSPNFYGFTAGTGEYFTGFSIASAQGIGSGPAIDNVTLGRASGAQVPEPCTLLLIGSGLVGLVSVRKKLGS